LVDIAPFNEATDPVAEAKAIVNELKKYDEDLYNKPRWLVLNKIDMTQDTSAIVKKFVKDYGWKGPVFPISAINGMGCKELTYAIMDHLDEVKKVRQEESEKSDTVQPLEKTEHESVIIKE